MPFKFNETAILDPGTSREAIVDAFKELNLILENLQTTLEFTTFESLTAIADLTGTAGATYTATEQAQINNMRVTVNTVLARLRSHELIDP